MWSCAQYIACHIMQWKLGEGFTGFKTHSPHTQTLFFYEKWKKEKGEIGGR